MFLEACLLTNMMSNNDLKELVTKILYIFTVV